MNRIKKVIVGAMLAMAITSTTALAAGDSCSFTFEGSKGYGNLSVDWNLSDPDSAWADTSHKSTTYYTTTYLESNKDGSISSTFDYGRTYSTVSMKRSTTRFNSSHGMADGSNVYNSLVWSTCSDW